MGGERCIVTSMLRLGNGSIMKIPRFYAGRYDVTALAPQTHPGDIPPGQPHRVWITFLSYVEWMKHKLNAELKAMLLASSNLPPAPIETIRKVRFKHINGVKVLLHEPEMPFSMN
jgi:hypothetical protein